MRRQPVDDKSTAESNHGLCFPKILFGKKASPSGRLTRMSQPRIRGRKISRGLSARQPWTTVVYGSQPGIARGNSSTGRRFSLNKLPPLAYPVHFQLVCAYQTS